jgi:hypothetical protein
MDTADSILALFEVSKVWWAIGITCLGTVTMIVPALAERQKKSNE